MSPGILNYKMFMVILSYLKVVYLSCTNIHLKAYYSEDQLSS